MANKVYILRGLPGSGKSTKAKQMLADIPNSIRLNKDTLREMTYFSEYSGKREGHVDAAEIHLIGFFLRRGLNVIVDDTNLNSRADRIKDTLRNLKIYNPIEIVDIDTDVNECILRDFQRVGRAKVGKHVILGMALKNKMYKFPNPVVIVDVDGTLANIDHRLHFVKTDGKKDWKGFFANISKDTLRQDVYDLLEIAYPANRYTRVLVSGRGEEYRDETEVWLAKQGVKYEVLFMRPAKDNRDDTIIKREIYDNYLRDQRVVAAFDDRPRILRLWKELEIEEIYDVGHGVEF